MLVKFTMYFRRNFLESMKTIHFWKAYNISNQKNNVYICSDVDMAAILHFVQNGRHETGFCKYLSKIFLESMKTIHIWKACNIRNQKKTMFILAPSPIRPPSCICLQMATTKQVFVISQPVNNTEYENYTFLESLWYKK